MKACYVLVFILLSCTSHNPKYPPHWWKAVSQSELKWWEISPDTVNKDEVILSKRNELGLLSNFAPTPFTFQGKKYPNVEALWQSMKYPEGRNDPRSDAIKWEYTREQVEQLDGFAAKKAGSLGSKAMKKLKINWVSYKGKRLPYKVKEKGEHYKIIIAAMREKLRQNPKVKDVLLKTGNLELKADHKVSKDDPPAWKYYQIWMDIRQELRH